MRGLELIESALVRDTHNCAFEKEVRKFDEIFKEDNSLVSRLEAISDADGFVSAHVSMDAAKEIHFTADGMKIVVEVQKKWHGWLIPKFVLMMVRERLTELKKVLLQDRLIFHGLN